MPQTIFSVRMDENLKNEFEGLCDIFRMNMSLAIIIFARAVVRERKIPFEITEGKMNVTREGALEAIKSIREKAIQEGIADMCLEENNRETAKVRNGL